MFSHSVFEFGINLLYVCFFILLNLIGGCDSFCFAKNTFIIFKKQ